MPGGTMLTGPTESVGRANEVPPGIAELNDARELLHPRFLTQIGIKAHADVANQQTAFCRHLNALVIHIHQPIFCQRCQQRQIGALITSRRIQSSRVSAMPRQSASPVSSTC